ncbi:MAG: type II secretion system F family protein [Pirellula sp.]
MNIPKHRTESTQARTDGAAWRTSPLLPLELSADRQRSLISILAIAHEKQIPWVPLLRAFASEHRFWFRRAVLSLAARIDAGESLGKALANTNGLLPDGTVLAIRSAGDDKSLSRVFASLQFNGESHSQTNSTRFIAIVGYWITIMIPTVLVATGFAYFIVPTFQRMFDEFELRLAPPVKLIFAAIYFGALPLSLTVLLAGLLLLLYWFTPLGISLKRLLYRWNVGFSRSSYRQDLLSGIAIAVDSGASLTSRLHETASSYENRALRKKAARASRLIANGVDSWFALGRVGLVSMQESKALNLMANDSVRSWALLRMSREKMNESRNRRNTLVTVLHPLAILLLGFVVLCICFATFHPLTDLIHALS